MTIYVIAGQPGFISDRLMAPPKEAKPITDELHLLLLAQESAGRVIQWDVYPPVTIDAPLPSAEVLAAEARSRRDTLLRTVYDPAVAMLQRSLRLGNEASAAKLAEFDAWAVALQGVPEQPGFPHSIDWPEQPSAEAL